MIPEGPLAIDGRLPARLRDYVALARPDHWIKHLFIVPGIFAALLLRGVQNPGLWGDLALGLIGASATASANYVLNEWLDRDNDAHHPVKSQRPSVTRRLSPTLVWIEYLVLLALGAVTGFAVSPSFGGTIGCFAASGLVYNVPPLRTKDRTYLDVITESFNNLLRLVLGWTIVDHLSLPPASLLFAFWLGGAFLMATKRLAEVRCADGEIGLQALIRYRRSFRHYSQESLLLSAFTYSLCSSLFLGVFLVAIFVEYLRLGLRQGSPVQTPERLHQERRLVLLVSLLIVILALLTWIDLPSLERLMEPHYIEFGSA